MQDPRDIILGPVVSEKSYGVVQQNRYSFYVDFRANKTQIKKAVEEIFKVKVLNISTINTKPKPKRLGRSVGKSAKGKKAVVTLRAKDKIDFFQTV
ncbi:MAG: 50S ribosomal protein L23 [Actinomycetota bacterium]|jgi:large subunit ribosomal protein L23|nr:50S ribosomal protein L23 [Actinomycetota bacterium]